MALLSSLQSAVQSSGVLEYFAVTVVMAFALAIGIALVSWVAARWGF